MELQQKLADALVRGPQYLKLLTAGKTKEDGFTVRVKTSGYSGTLFLVADLLKVSMLALENEDADPAVNVAGLLELAIQLLPYQEMELLDIVHEGFLERG